MSPMEKMSSQPEADLTYEEAQQEIARIDKEIIRLESTISSRTARFEESRSLDDGAKEAGDIDQDLTINVAPKIDELRKRKTLLQKLHPQPLQKAA